MSLVHVLVPRGHYGEPQPAPASWPEKVIAGCCYCRMPKDQITVRFWQYPPIDPNDPWANFCDTMPHDVQCADGFGCKANPRRRIGMGQRQWGGAL